jgi:hypothetical protein
MSPGQTQVEKSELEKVKKTYATAKPVDLDGKFGN